MASVATATRLPNPPKSQLTQDEAGTGRSEAEAIQRIGQVQDLIKGKYTKPSEEDVDIPTTEEFKEDDEGEEAAQGEPIQNRTKEQKQAMECVMAAKSYKAMFQMREPKAYASVDEFRKLATVRFAYLAQHVHPKFNRDPQAKEAFERVKENARRCKVLAKNIELLDGYNGSFDEGLTLVNGAWKPKGRKLELLEGAENALQQGTKPESLRSFYEGVYKQAAPYLNSYGYNNDQDSKNQLDVLNSSIAQKNKEFNLPETTGTIEVDNVVGQIRNLLQILSWAEANPSDREIMTKFKNGAEMFAAFNKSKGYPSDWYVPLPTEIREAWRQLEQPQYARLGGYMEVDDGRTPGSTESSSPKIDAVNGTQQADPTASPETDRQTGPIAAPETDPVSNIQVDLASEQSTLPFPWQYDCGKTADGQWIVSHWKLHWNRNKQDCSGTRCVVIGVIGGQLVPSIRSGSECGLLQVKRYLALPNIHCMNEESKTRGWSYTDRDDYVSMQFVASAEYKTHQTGKNFRAPTTVCGVWMKKGFYLIVRSDVQAIVGDKSARAEIDACCEKQGTTPPHQIQPQRYITPGSQNERPVLASDSGATTSTTDEILNTLKKIEQRLSFLESKPPVESTTTNTTEKTTTTENPELEKRLETLETMLGTMAKSLDAVVKTMTKS